MDGLRYWPCRLYYPQSPLETRAPKITIRDRRSKFRVLTLPLNLTRSNVDLQALTPLFCRPGLTNPRTQKFNALLFGGGWDNTGGFLLARRGRGNSGGEFYGARSGRRADLLVTHESAQVLTPIP